jgi:hypothetical protein
MAKHKTIRRGRSWRHMSAKPEAEQRPLFDETANGIDAPAGRA